LDRHSYHLCKKDITVRNNKQDSDTVKKFISQKLHPLSASSLILPNSVLGKPCLNLLHKIQKPDNTGRSNVFDCSCPTEHISDFQDSILQPFASRLPTYIKDTNHALRLFSNFFYIALLHLLTHLLFVIDVSSLYTSIPHADGLEALKHYLDQCTNPDIPTSIFLLLI
jgi:hypothetical protein